MKGLLLATDLMFATRVLGAAQAAGQTVEICPTVAKLLEKAAEPEVRLVLVDLGLPGLDLGQVVPALRAAAPAAHITAFGAHVDVERLQAAAAAGCHEVLTRNQFHQTYVKILSQYLDFT